jgi:hypothetical protein
MPVIIASQIGMFRYNFLIRRNRDTRLVVCNLSTGEAGCQTIIFRHGASLRAFYLLS